MKNLFKNYLPYFRAYKKASVFIFLGMTTVAISTVAIAKMVEELFNNIFMTKNSEIWTVILLFFFFLFIIKALGNYIKNYYSSYIALHVSQKLQNNLVRNFTYQEIYFFQTTNKEKFLQQITKDITEIQSIINTTIPDFIQEFLVITALTTYLIYLSSPFILSFFLILLITLYPLYFLEKKRKHYAKYSEYSSFKIHTYLNEIFSNIEFIQSNSTQNLETKKFQTENQHRYIHLLKQLRFTTLLNPIKELLLLLIMATMIYIGSLESIKGEMNNGELISFIVALFMLYKPIQKILREYNNIQNPLLGYQRIEEQLNQQKNIQSGEIELNEQIKHLSIMKISSQYANKDVLNRVSVGIDRGETIALVGENDSEKSSLIRLLLRFQNPISGDILINEKYNLRDLTLESLRKKVAYITQPLYILNDTIAHNVAYGQEFNREKIVEALKKSYALEFVEALDKGIDTLLTDKGETLSIGEKQRIALARAVYKQPDILIINDSFSTLDNNSKTLIQKALHELKSEMMTITVAYHLSNIENSDAIFVFKKGEIVCRGQHEDLINECTEYQKLAKVLA